MSKFAAITKVLMLIGAVAPAGVAGESVDGGAANRIRSLEFFEKNIRPIALP